MAVIIMNRFVIAPMFAPPTKSSSEILTSAFQNTQSSTQVAKGLTLASQLGRPKDQTGMEYAYVYKKESNWLLSLGSVGSPI